MSYVIVFENPEDPNRISIMTPTGEVSTDELIRLKIDVTKPYKIMLNTELPYEDDVFFEAWKLVNDTIIIDLEKSKEIHRNILRRERIKLFSDLDIQFMRAIEQGDTVKQQEISTKKQKLRDLPSHSAIQSASTTAELRSLTLDFLMTL